MTRDVELHGMKMLRNLESEYTLFYMNMDDSSHPQRSTKQSWCHKFTEIPNAIIVTIIVNKLMSSANLKNNHLSKIPATGCVKIAYSKSVLFGSVFTDIIAHSSRQRQ